MCLITPDHKLYIAEEDITVYKILDRDFSPRFQGGKPYEFGVVYETKLEPSGSDACFLGGVDIEWYEDNLELFGFQAYYNALRSPKILQIGQGFHSFATKDMLPKAQIQGVYVECTIPKGAEYHTSPFGLMVSNKIIINHATIKEIYNEKQ